MQPARPAERIHGAQGNYKCGALEYIADKSIVCRFYLVNFVDPI